MVRIYKEWRKLIKEYFLEFPDSQVTIKRLIRDITGNEFIDYSDDWDDIYNSVCRTIRKLEKELFLETRVFTCHGVRDFLDKNDLPTRIKIIRMLRINQYSDIAWDFEREGVHIFEIK